MSPFYSIIAPVFNSGPKLERTVESVLSQDHGDFEFLAVDGGSSDGSRERLEAFRDARMRVVSEPDRGIYDAMNKGIGWTRGRYLNFLGAGDELLPGVLRQMREHLPEDGLTAAYGNAQTPWDEIYDGKFTRRKLCRRNICHQTMFYGRRVFEMIGLYDLNYPLMADWELNLRCFGHRRVRMVHVPLLVAKYEGGGLSDAGDKAFTADKEILIRKHLGWLTYAYFLKRKWRRNWKNRLAAARNRSAA